MNATMPYIIVPCQAVPDLPDHLRLTYALLLGLAHGTADGATPPVTRRELAELRHCSMRAIDAHLAALRRAGLVDNAPGRVGQALVLVPRPLPGLRALAPESPAAMARPEPPAYPPLTTDGEPSAYALMVRAGVYPAIAVTLSQRPWITPELVQAWINHLRGARHVRHPGGLLASLLRRGDIGMPPPPVPADDEGDTAPRDADAAADDPAEDEPDLAELGSTWDELRERLAAALPQRSLATWLEGSRPVLWDGRVLVIGTRSWLAADYLKQRGTAELDKVLTELTGRPVSLRFQAARIAAGR